MRGSYSNHQAQTESRGCRIQSRGSLDRSPPYLPTPLSPPRVGPRAPGSLPPLPSSFVGWSGLSISESSSRPPRSLPQRHAAPGWGPAHHLFVAISARTVTLCQPPREAAGSLQRAAGLRLGAALWHVAKTWSVRSLGDYPPRSPVGEISLLPLVFRGRMSAAQGQLLREHTGGSSSFSCSECLPGQPATRHPALSPGWRGPSLPAIILKRHLLGSPVFSCLGRALGAQFICSQLEPGKRRSGHFPITILAVNHWSPLPL